MQLAVVLPARSGRNAEDAEAARVLRAIGDQVVVMDGLFDTPRPRWRPLLRAQADAGTAVPGACALSQALSNRRQVDWFTPASRGYPPPRRAFRHYRRADVWQPGRFVISRWVARAASITVKVALGPPLGASRANGKPVAGKNLLHHG